MNNEPNSPIKSEYKQWIIDNYPTPNSAINLCREACEKMKEAFPELTLTNGLIQVGTEKDERTHWWCKDPEGNVVDPTAHQYKIFGMRIVFYNEIDDEHDLRKYPQGKCANCGETYFIGKNNWGDSTTCSSKCFQDYCDYLNKG